MGDVDKAPLMPDLGAWREVCEFLDARYRKCAYATELPEHLRWLLWHPGSKRAQAERESAHLVFYSPGWGWRLRRGWRERLDELAHATTKGTSERREP